MKQQLKKLKIKYKSRNFFLFSCRFNFIVLLETYAAKMYYYDLKLPSYTNFSHPRKSWLVKAEQLN